MIIQNPGKEKLGVGLETLLNIFDGLLSQENQLIIATTNYIEKIDIALIRPGRFNVKSEFGLLKNNEIIKIIENFYKTKLNNSENINLKEISIAELISICNSSININECVFKLENKEIEMKDVYPDLFIHGGSSDQALEQEIENEDNLKIYLENQKKWVKAFKIRKGSIVKVLRIANSFEYGWNINWIDRMNKTIGQELKVQSIGINGVELENDCHYPYFVLEK